MGDRLHTTCRVDALPPTLAAAVHRRWGSDSRRGVCTACRWHRMRATMGGGGKGRAGGSGGRGGWKERALRGDPAPCEGRKASAGYAGAQEEGANGVGGRSGERKPFVQTPFTPKYRSQIEHQHASTVFRYMPPPPHGAVWSIMCVGLLTLSRQQAAQAGHKRKERPKTPFAHRPVTSVCT